MTKKMMLALTLILPLQVRSLQGQHFTPDDHIKIFLGCTFGSLGLVAFSIIGLERLPKVTFGAWAVGTTMFLSYLNKRYAEIKKYEARPHVIVLQEAQQLINHIQKDSVYQNQLTLAEQITRELNEDQKAIVQDKLRKSIWGLHRIAPVQWQLVSQDFNRLHYYTTILQQRIVQISFSETAQTTDKTLLEQLQKAHTEIDALKLRLHRLMTVLSQL